MYAVNTNIVNDPKELDMFNAAMAFVLSNIEKPERELVQAAFAKAPQEIVEYFAQDKWFTCQPDPKNVPMYSVVAREMLMEQIVLGDAERK